MNNFKKYLLVSFDFYGTTLIVISFFLLLFFYYNQSDIVVVGVVASFLASFIALFIQHSIYQIRQVSYYLKLGGAYSCFSYSKEKDPSDNQIYNNGSKAEIIYVKNNELTIINKDTAGNSWEGKILMNSKYSGDINWHYTELKIDQKNARNRNGLKRLTVLYAKDGLRVNLFSENDARFGREVLIKETDNGVS